MLSHKGSRARCFLDYACLLSCTAGACRLGGGGPDALAAHLVILSHQGCSPCCLLVNLVLQEGHVALVDVQAVLGLLNLQGQW